jgi:thiamine-phosphate pyrophosphorylase
LLKRSINRIIDANINRTKEGLRVCEEIARFTLDSRSLTLEFKKIRHRIEAILKRLPNRAILIRERESLSDVGKNIALNELKRRDYRDIFFANIQRVKESVRVLEEFTKLINKDIALEFKKTRYLIYEIEKKGIAKITSFKSRRKP